MNAISRMGKVIRTLGVMGIMMALAGFMAGGSAQSASAAGITPRVEQGKLNVFATLDNGANTVPVIKVVVFDRNANVVASGYAAGDGSFGAKLAPGAYRVNVSSEGYKPYSEAVSVISNSTTTVKAALEADETPTSTTSTSDLGSVSPVATAQGKLDVFAVIDPSSTHAVAIEIAITNEKGVLISKGYAAADGSYGIKLDPGSYKVQVNAPGYKSYGEVVTIKADNTTSIKAELEADR